MSTTAAISIEQYLATAYEPDHDFVDGGIEERNVGELKHSQVQLKVGAYLLAQYERSGAVVVTEFRIRVSSTRVRIPDVSLFLSEPTSQVPTEPPFVCVEILSPEDRMSRIEVRIQDYLDMGVPFVWLLDPLTRQAYLSTAAEGLREVKDGVLRTKDPVIELPLMRIWG